MGDRYLCSKSSIRDSAETLKGFVNLSVNLHQYFRGEGESGDSSLKINETESNFRQAVKKIFWIENKQTYRFLKIIKVFFEIL